MSRRRLHRAGREAKIQQQSALLHSVSSFRVFARNIWDDCNVQRLLLAYIRYGATRSSCLISAGSGPLHPHSDEAKFCTPGVAALGGSQRGPREAWRAFRPAERPTKRSRLFVAPFALRPCADCRAIPHKTMPTWMGLVYAPTNSRTFPYFCPDFARPSVIIITELH